MAQKSSGGKKSPVMPGKGNAPYLPGQEQNKAPKSKLGGGVKKKGVGNAGQGKKKK